MAERLTPCPAPSWERDWIETEEDHLNRPRPIPQPINPQGSLIFDKPKQIIYPDKDGIQRNKMGQESPNVGSPKNLQQREEDRPYFLVRDRERSIREVKNNLG